MKRTLRNTLSVLLSSALTLPLVAGAQTGIRTPVEAGGKGPMAPMAIAPFAPNATLTESFDVIPGTDPNKCPTGWTCTNLSAPLGVTNWFQGTSAFPAQAGPATGYIAANFNNTTGGAGVISNWLLTPQVNFATGAELRFWTRVPAGGGAYPDRLEVRISTAGASTNVGANATSVGDFTTTIITINPNLLTTAGTCPPAAGGYPEAWCEIVLGNAQGIPTTGSGRIAFRYNVTSNAGPAGSNSNFIGIDTFSYTDTPPLPPPTTPLQLFDGVTAPAQPTGWTATSNTAANWATATPGTPAAVSAPNVEAVTGNVFSTDAVLTSGTFNVLAVPAQLGFFRSAATPGLESGFDGMVMEISVNGGAFADAVTAGGTFTANGYNGTVSANFGSPIAGRAAWTGTQAAFIQSIYALPASATVGSTVQFRWRAATDTSVNSGVVQIDSLTGTGLGVGTDVALTLTDAPDPVNAGTSVTYTATATNNGPVGADGIVINLPLPTGTTFVSATPSAGGVCNAASPVVCTFAGTTAVAAAASVTVVAAVPANTANGAVLSATATSTSTTIDTNPANNTATTTTTVGTSSDVSVTITDAPDPVVAGTNLTYTVTVANAGPSDAQGVTATMATPTGTTLVSAPGPIGTLAAGASVQSTFVFTVTPAVLSGTVITGTATVASSTTDPNAANNTASTTTTVSAEANLAATLTASASAVLVNVPVTFSATSTNLGPSDAQNVVLAITLSPDFRYAGHTASAGAVCTTPQVGNSGVISCTWAGATAPNAVRTLDVSAFSNNDNQNTVSVATSSATTDPVAANNTASVVVTVGFLIEEIPSLNGLGLALLGLMLALAGFVAVRRNS